MPCTRNIERQPLDVALVYFARDNPSFRLDFLIFLETTRSTYFVQDAMDFSSQKARAKQISMVPTLGRRSRIYT